MEEIMIKIDNVTKQYKLGQIGGTTLRDELQRLNAILHHKEDPTKRIGAKDYNKGETFMALNGVSFEVKKGERVGIIGHNGAGKSTLLKLLSRVTAPTSGEIGLNGRVASMLEVGTGFHGELTGRENIYMNGAILGMSKKEIDAKIEDIIEFSECRQFIDTPVKRYSSGMYVKLAFSVAAHLDSEIMIMDEVLAVGDMAFQKKCLDKMNDVSRKGGRTILYVSHNMNTIRQLCDRVVVLDHGMVVFDGEVEEGISNYMNSATHSLKLQNTYEPSKHSTRGNYEAKFLGIDIQNKTNACFYSGENVSLIIHGETKGKVKNIGIRFEIKREDNIIGTSFSNATFDIDTDSFFDIPCSFSTAHLAPGRYCCTALFFTSLDNGRECFYDRVEPAFWFEILQNENDELIWLHNCWGNIHLEDIVVEKPDITCKY